MQRADGSAACAGSAGSGSGVAGGRGVDVLDAALSSGRSLLQKAACREQREQGDTSAGHLCLCVPDADGEHYDHSLGAMGKNYNLNFFSSRGDNQTFQESQNTNFTIV